MSKQEFSRLDVLLRVQSGRLRVSDAGVLIGLQRRQVFRTGACAQGKANSSLKPKFPASRENTGNFVRLGLRGRLLARNTGPNSMVCDPIPYESEQGIYFALA
jgi:hypothetical protein